MNSKRDIKPKLSLVNVYSYDTLTLYAEYKECGEWGGHTEIFKIYDKNNGEMWSDYKKDTVNCKGGVSRKIIYEKSLKLTQEHQTLIIQYIQALLERNFIDDPVMSNAGERYSAISSDSSLVISYFTSHFSGFEKLRGQILQ